jgi:alkanesulfonate monooxygenase SsuD/methylene tetrahydromethanopterin reductase-like flavin-dependent oxidoreductase (luciferase family)
LACVADGCMEMTDRGRELQFGVSVVPFADPPEFALRVTQAAEEAGLDLVGIQDHPYQNRFLDAWTLIATLVPSTEHVSFYLSVANLPLRPPARLAKAVTSLEVISSWFGSMLCCGGNIRRVVLFSVAWCC